MSDAMLPTDLTCDDVRASAGAFVLGALEPADEAAIRDHLLTCADAHAEIAEVGSVLPILDASIPQLEPSPGLKARILAAAAADLEERQSTRSNAGALGSVAPTVVPAAPGPSTAPSEPIPFPTAEERTARAAGRVSPRALAWGLRIAAVLAIAVLGGWNVLLQGQLGQARTYERSIATVLDVAGQSGSVTAVLTAKGGSGAAGLAAVASNGTVYLAMHDLAPTVGNQVYEAWVIGTDGVPVALGGFTVGSDQTAVMQATGVPAIPGNTLALTLEPAPGATAPGGPVVSAGATAG